MSNFVTSVSAEKIASLINGKVVGDPARIVNGVAALKDAAENHASFIGNKKYLSQLENSKAGVVLIGKDLENEQLNGKTFIVCDNVDLAFSIVISLFAPPVPKHPAGVHPSAVIGKDVKLGINVSIGPNAVVEDNAEIGDETIIGAGCYIGHEAKIGAKCVLYPNVVVMYRCILGNLVVLQPGVVIGGDGFGFIPGPTGLVKVPQTGIVQIDNDVEIGANSTVDRARFGKTWIKSNVKVDNQVMIAHNVVIGESSILVAQSGIAGSAELGRGVILAAKAGINGHITIGDKVQVAGCAGVAKSVPPGQIVLGVPAEGQREFMGRLTLPGKVEKLQAKIKALEEKIAELEKNTK